MRCQYISTRVVKLKDITSVGEDVGKWGRSYCSRECKGGRATLVESMALSTWTADKHTPVQFSSVAQSCPTPCDPMDVALQASLDITNSRNWLKFMSIESVMPSSHLILCCPFLLLPSIFSSIRVFSDESVLRIRWPKYWSFSFSISPSSEYSGLISL